MNRCKLHGAEKNGLTKWKKQFLIKERDKMREKGRVAGGKNWPFPRTRRRCNVTKETIFHSPKGGKTSEKKGKTKLLIWGGSKEAKNSVKERALGV